MDVSEQSETEKGLEETLRRRQAELQILFDLIPAMIWFKDTQNNHLRVNELAARGTGKTVKEIEGRPCAEVYPNEADRFYADDLEVIASGHPKLGIIEKIQLSDSQAVWIQTDKVPYHDNDGKVIGIIVMAQDVTERKRAEDALRESENRFRFLHDLSEAGRTLDDPDALIDVMVEKLGRYLRVSRCGYAEKEGNWITASHEYTDGCPNTKGRHNLEDFGPGMAALSLGQTLVVRNADTELAPEGGRDSFNAIGIKAIIVCPLFKKGTFRAMIAVHQVCARDWKPEEIALVQEVAERCWFTLERKEAAEHLLANEVLLREFIRHTPAAIAMLDREMRYVQASERWSQDYHIEAKELIGKSHYEVFPDVPLRWKEIHQHVLNGAVERCEEDPFPRADGTTDWLRWEARPWQKAGGEIGGLIFFTEVITERKKAEIALRERARLAELEAETRSAWTRGETLAETLKLCCEAVVRHLQGAFARIWTWNEAEQVLELKASAGLYTHLDGPHGRVPVGKFKIGLIAQERKPHLTNQVLGDPRVGDQAWAKREGLVAFAGYPLIAGDQLLGVIAMFARQPLPEVTLTALASVAENIAVNLERCRWEAELKESNEKFQQLADNVNDAFWIAAPHIKEIQYLSPAFERIWGRPPECLYTRPEQWLDFIVPEDRARVETEFDTLSTNTSSIDLEYRIMRPESDERWVRVQGFQVHDGGGELIRLIGVATDITERKLAEEVLQRTQTELLRSSRHAGMAEVATGILHNVGNVLNSVNVSASCLADRLRKSKSVSVAKVAALLAEQQSNLGTFLTEDPRGRQIPQYLKQLAEHLAAEQAAALEELAGLQKNIEHIKGIVILQQGIANVSGVMETFWVADLVEDALKINASSLVRHDVKVVRDFQPVPPVTLDKHKVLQILVNLVSNAKQSCDELNPPEKRLMLRVAAVDGRVLIEVTDNGVGIPPENLTRIFAHGFTTKKDGHGFGLHSGELAAKEMGGSLTVTSQGLGFGATFTLTLPGEGVA